MTNTFITPQVIARRALATLYNDAVLAASFSATGIRTSRASRATP
jgi:hypothetical protein